MTVIDGVHVAEWGDGPRVVLIHGGTPGGGADAFAAQKPLQERWRLVLPDRPGHGESPRQGREDFERDAVLLAPLLEGGAHLVGHSYGGVVALYMAAAHPEAIASLTLIEVPAVCFAPDDPVVRAFSTESRSLFVHPPADPVELMRRFFALLGISVAIPDPAPEVFVDIATAFAKDMVQIRPPDEADVDASALANANYAVLLLTSGQIGGFEHIADAIVGQVGGVHVVVPGTDHLLQNAGDAVNPIFEEHWLGAGTSTRA